MQPQYIIMIISGALLIAAAVFYKLKVVDPVKREQAAGKDISQVIFMDPYEADIRNLKAEITRVITTHQTVHMITKILIWERKYKGRRDIAPITIDMDRTNLLNLLEQRQELLKVTNPEKQIAL